jgi:predicted AAA+ superfamily ATPase
MRGHYHRPTAEERGALLEGWVGGLLRARQAYAGLYDELCYWAPAQGGTEVDFLLRRGTEIIAIEVKSTPRPSPREFAGLRAIAELPATKRRLLVHLGERAFNTPDGIEALPAGEFARQLAAGHL